MSGRVTIGSDGAIRPGAAGGLTLVAVVAERWRALRHGLGTRSLARETRRATDALEPRMREDVGLGSRSEQPQILPLADNWMR